MVDNYRTICDATNGVPLAAVVKADGYGLGAVRVARTLWDAGCRRFFVARVDEGVTLREGLAEHSLDAEIIVFDGLVPGTAEDLVSAGLVPVLNSLPQLEAWQKVTADHGRPLGAGLHIDTGMRRLGLDPDEYRTLRAEPHRLDGIELRHVLSHLACADVPDNTESAVQLEAFTNVRTELPLGTASLANSAGVFLGSDYHFDLVRPGISLYGGSPFPDSGRDNPMRTVVTVEAPIVQIRRATEAETVGYGGTYTVQGEARLATVAAGYADGFLRSSSNSGVVAIGGTEAPIVGRVSMDLITIDVSGFAETEVQPGTPVELLGPNRPIDDVAVRAETIPYEFLTNLSRRYERHYRYPTED